MKNRDSKEWIWPPADQWVTVWGMLVFALVGVLFTQLFSFFSHLSGVAWLWFYGIALFFGGIGVCLLFYAKLPLYRERRFFTFGPGALPPERRPFYRWGYRCAAVSIALLVWLLYCGILTRSF